MRVLYAMHANCHRTLFLKPVVDAANGANAKFNELIYGKNESKKLSEFEAKSKELGKKIAQDQEVRLSLEIELKANQVLLASNGNLPLESGSFYKDKVTQLQKELKKVNERIPFNEKLKLEVDTETKKIVSANQNYTNNRASKQKLEYQKRESIAAAKSIAENPLLKNQLSEEFKESVKRIVHSESKAAELIASSTENPAQRKEYESAMKELKEAKTAFENKFGETMRGVVRTFENEPIKRIDSVKGILKKDQNLTTLVPGMTKEKAIPFYLNESTGEFRIGEVYHQEPMYYANQAVTIFRQADLKFLLSLETANIIKTEILSDSEASYLRSKWCVAVSTWGMLKRNFGDAVPDFTTFTKDMVNAGFINPSNMELSSTNGGTANIVNYYAKPSGKSFDRVSLEGAGNRADRYEALAGDLIKNRPQAITLRVKEDTKTGAGHTISLQRNSDGRTYTVIDTSQPTINNSIFDPENLESSPLVNELNQNNPYAGLSPKGYDYVK